MWRLVTLSALLTVPVGAGAQVNIDESAPRITVRVYSTSLRPSEFRSASELAGRVLQATGIAVSWVHCWSAGQAKEALPVDCERPMTQSDVVVQAIHATDPNSARHPESLGFSMIDLQAGAGTVATVYTDRVAMMARKAGVHTVDLLAWAMAHEIGHLLLGTSQHAARGLMRARWSQAEVRRHSRQDWSFSVDEAQTMRDILRARGMAEPVLLTSSTIGN